MNGITRLDFYPFNEWQVDGTSNRLVDTSTNRSYLHKEALVVKRLCALIFLTAPLHVPLAIGNVAFRALRLVSLYHYWKEEKRFAPSDRLYEVKMDVCRILISPAFPIVLASLAIYGMIFDRAGRKLIGTVQLAFYGKSFFFPCFAPSTIRAKKWVESMANKKALQKNDWNDCIFYAIRMPGAGHLREKLKEGKKYSFPTDKEKSLLECLAKRTKLTSDYAFEKDMELRGHLVTFAESWEKIE